MDTKVLDKQLQIFDPDLYALLDETLKRQISSLSLIPTDSATSPFAQYLKGSVLGNDFIGQHSLEHYGRIETMAAKRACEIFKSEHAIVRVGNLGQASRVVMLGLLKNGDNILSFNLRKSEHCSGSQMQYNFIKFAIEPNTLRIDFDKLRKLAIQNKPKMIIYSPVNYPLNIDYSKLREIADEVGAYLWIDLVQNAGLIATGKIPSPIPFADVSTFAASDSLHGPQSGIILCKQKLGEILDRTVIETGHSSMKKNVLASLAVIFHEVACEGYQDFADQVLKNARALEKGLKSSGTELICSPTENHLVLVRLSDHQISSEIAEKLAKGGLLVKAEKLMTSNINVSFPVLRLSSLDPTTRSLTEEDMFAVGELLGNFLKTDKGDKEIAKVAKFIKKLVEALPLFSNEWLPAAEIGKSVNSDLMMKAMIYGSI